MILNEKIYYDSKIIGIVNKKQIGFIKYAGCDLKILKLRERAKNNLEKVANLIPY